MVDICTNQATSTNQNECKVLLIKQRQIISRIQLKGDGIIKPLSLISIHNLDSVLFITQKQHNNDDDEDEDEDDDMNIDNKNNKYLHCFIIKRDSYHQHKLSIQKQYNQWFMNNNDIKYENDSNYKCVEQYKFKNSYHFYNFDTKYLLLISYKMGENTFKIKLNKDRDNSNFGYIFWNFKYWNIKKLILYKIPKFFEQPLRSLECVRDKRLQNCFKLNIQC